MATEFIAIDLETANSDVRSICQVGLVRFRHGAPHREWMSYVNPRDHFDPMNVGIHGITEAKVRSSPDFPQMAGYLREMLDGEIVISHTHFDRVALGKALEGHGIPGPDCNWLDSAMIARRAWRGLRDEGGYGLANLCGILGYSYQHHDALADAKAAGAVVLAAIEQTDVGLDQWLRQVKLPVSEGPQVSIRTNPAFLNGWEAATVMKTAVPTGRLDDDEKPRAKGAQARSGSQRSGFGERLARRRRIGAK